MNDLVSAPHSSIAFTRFPSLPPRAFLGLGLATLLCLAGCKSTPESQADSKEGGAAVKSKSDDGGGDAKPWCDHCKCKKGKTIDGSKSKLQSCELKKDTKIQGVKAKGGKKVTFNKDGWLTRFTAAKPTKVSGVVCKKGTGVELEKPGKLRSCHTKKTVEIDGVSCTGGISLHRKSGKLSRCKLAEGKKFGSLDMPKGSWITLDKDGKAHRFEVKKAVEVDGKKCKGFMNYVWPSGKLKKCQLADETEIDGKKYDKKAAVCFDEEGKVRDCKGLKFKLTG